MANRPEIPFQSELFGDSVVSFDASYATVQRIDLDATSWVIMLGRGDLLVTGGRTNRNWEHTVPKVSQAGPRISVAFRHGLDPRAYSDEGATHPSG